MSASRVLTHVTSVSMSLTRSSLAGSTPTVIEDAPAAGVALIWIVPSTISATSGAPELAAATLKLLTMPSRSALPLASHPFTGRETGMS